MEQSGSRVMGETREVQSEADELMGDRCVSLAAAGSGDHAHGHRTTGTRQDKGRGGGEKQTGRKTKQTKTPTATAGPVTIRGNRWRWWRLFFRCCIIGNWTCFSFLRMFQPSSKRPLRVCPNRHWRGSLGRGRSRCEWVLSCLGEELRTALRVGDRSCRWPPLFKDGYSSLM